MRRAQCTLYCVLMKRWWWSSLWLYFDWCLSLIGWPRLKWVVTDSKYLTKPSKDWQPHIPTANTDPAYIEVTELLTGQLLGGEPVAAFEEIIFYNCVAQNCVAKPNNFQFGNIKSRQFPHPGVTCLFTRSSCVSSLFSTRQVKRAQWWVWLCLK